MSVRTHPIQPRRRSPAFTLIELMIVIAIFLILIAIAVPAFASMLYSSEQSLAENSLRSALSSAREAAVRSPEGQDAVAVFIAELEYKYDSNMMRYRPVGYHTQALTCVYAGKLRNPPTGVTAPVQTEYEVFAAAPGTKPVQFPRGWSVRGYAPPDSIDDVWYEKTYPSTNARDRGNWVFPETGFYDEDSPQKGDDRQTFVVRFEGGTGTVKSADQTPILVLLPSPSVVFHTMGPWKDHRADTAPDSVRFVQQVLSAPVVGAPPLAISPDVRRQLIGFESPSSIPPLLATDCVLAKPVGQLAVYNEKRLSQAIGVGLDRGTDSLYQDPLSVREPRWVNTRSGAPWSDADTVRLNDWIEGHLLDQSNQPIDSDCRVFVVQRYLGSLQEVTGTSGGQGVGQ